MSALQPDAATAIDRTITAPFLLRLFWRLDKQLDPVEFSVAVPEDISNITDYSSLLPSHIKQQTMQIYTWPNCTLAELTTLFTSVLPKTITLEHQTRLVFKLIFPDTRATVSEGGRGKWIDKPLGSVIIGGSSTDMDVDGAENGPLLEGDAKRTLSDARFVIGDYVACSIYPPNPDGTVAPLPARGPPRDGGFAGPRGPPRENGYSGGGYGGGYGRGRGGYGGRGGGGYHGPPPGDWRRGERVGGYDGGRGGRDRGGRPY